VELQVALKAAQTELAQRNELLGAHSSLSQSKLIFLQL
jgi:hypothetical protein